MIRIRVRRHAAGLEILARGHAGYAERGADIVCAGVSALLYGLVHHLETSHAPSAAVHEGWESIRSADIDDSGDRRAATADASAPVLKLRSGDGYLWVWTQGMDGADALAWAVTRAGLSLIEAGYPAHVELTEEE